MAFKRFTIDDQTTVTIYKRKTNRNLRLSIDSKGEVRVTIPLWAPYVSGLKFATSRLTWIKTQRPDKQFLKQGQAIGKAHHLQFVAGAAAVPSSRIVGGLIRVNYPKHQAIFDSDIQHKATTASIRALRLQAEQLLPQRVAKLAELHDYQYRTVTIKRLKSRWGSCDHQGNIVLNLYLMQLPWECIDYVIVHELVHTVVMRHGPNFWRVMKQELPNVDELKRLVRSYQPILDSSVEATVA